MNFSKPWKKLNDSAGCALFVPIAKKIRDDKGYWNQIESYIYKHSEAEFSHGICPEWVKDINAGAQIGLTAAKNRPDQSKEILNHLKEVPTFIIIYKGRSPFGEKDAMVAIKDSTPTMVKTKIPKN